MLNIVILISGKGSNLQAIIDAIADGLPAKILAVICNKPDAFGLVRAQNANIPTKVIDHRAFANHADYDRELLATVKRYDPDLIIMAGYMRILASDFIQQFPQKIINIHPSLLPKYKGLNTHQRVLEAGEKLHGVSIHYVTEELDSGQLIAQESFPIEPDDTAETLQQKAHKVEHRLYPQVIAQLAQQKNT